MRWILWWILWWTLWCVFRNVFISFPFRITSFQKLSRWTSVAASRSGVAPSSSSALTSALAASSALQRFRSPCRAATCSDSEHSAKATASSQESYSFYELSYNCMKYIRIIFMNDKFLLFLRLFLASIEPVEQHRKPQQQQRRLQRRRRRLLVELLHLGLVLTILH